MKNMLFVQTSFLAFLFAVSGATVAFAQETLSLVSEEQPGAEIGQETTGTPRQVILENLPPITPGGSGGAIPAPRTGVSEEEYRVLKERTHEMEQRRDQMEIPPRVEERHNEARARFEERRTQMQQRHEEMRQRIEARHEELRERWEARKVKLSEMRKQIIKNHIERIIKRMKATVDRLTRLADKVDERIGIIASDGADVSNATSLMTDARGAIARAQTELNEATAGLRAAPETDNPAEGIGNARARFENVKAALREAHAALVEVIKSLKGRSATTPNAQDADEEPAVNE